MENTNDPQMEATHASSRPTNEEARATIAFCVLTSAMQKSLERALQKGQGRLFTTRTEGLYERFLEAFEDPIERQHHSCHACRRFIRRFGGALWIDVDGQAGSALWGEHDDEVLDALSPAFRRVIAGLRQEVESRPVYGQLLWGERRWGLAEAGGFTHLWADADCVSFNVTQTPRQAMAEWRAAYVHLTVAFSRMEARDVERAVGMLEAGGLEGAEKLLAMGRFVRDTQARASELSGEQRRRLIWAAVAKAPLGWCSPRGSAFGALVEDIREGRSVEAITRAHDSRVAPDKYQRPKAAPSSGNIAQAEKLVAELGVAPSLPRRPLALAELTEALWVPPPPKAPPHGAVGVFGDLTRKTALEALESLASRVQTMTWAKFARDVLPRAQSLALAVPLHGPFAALTTAVDLAAPPLFRWDRPEWRNRVSWYTHVHGSPASQWALRGGMRATVLAICEMPCVWGDGKQVPANVSLAGGRLLAVLQGAEDAPHMGLGLFPECLRSELHPVRATIEAYSCSHSLGHESRQRASGCIIGAGPVILEAKTTAGVANYAIDRLE